VELQRGRGTRLTPLGERILQADVHVRATLERQFEKLRAEVRAMLEPALSARRPALALHASHDLLLPELAHLCAPRLRLEIAFRGADESLASLSRGECDLAGFHVADALPRAAAAAASLGRWLDPRRHQLVHFVAREQGIIVRPGARIRGVYDLARPGVRFINRPPAGSGQDLDLAIAAEVAGGRADAGFGLRAAAARHKLDFVPLATERYYLAATRRALRESPMQALLEALRGQPFQEAVRRLPGYDASNAGTRETLAAALGWLARPRKESG
jgi:molybdate-binding protein